MLNKELQQPLISVVIPFYKGADWLSEAINSVYLQTYQNYEIILVNDGSNEDISYIIDTLDNRFFYVLQKNRGPAAARNKGIEKSKGKYIAFLDSDDIWENQKLELQVRLMEDNNLQWSHTAFTCFNDGSDEQISVDMSAYRGRIYPKCLYSCRIATPTIMIKKTVLEDLLFDEEMRLGEDTLLWINLAIRYPLGLVDKELVRIRKTGNTASRNIRMQLLTRARLYDKLRSLYGRKIDKPSGIGKLSYRWCSFARRLLGEKSKIHATKLYIILAGLLYAPAYLGFKLAFISCRKMSPNDDE